MGENHTYSPAEVCEMFGISRSTLLRWEREGTISSARRVRNSNTDQRSYTQENLREIGQQMKRQLAQQFKRTAETDDEDEITRTLESLYIWRLFQGDSAALESLESYPSLSANSIRKLCRIGLERYEPSSPTFHRIANIVAEQSGKLSKGSHA